MVEIIVPLRGEKVLEDNGTFTIKYQDYLEQLQNSINAASERPDATEAAFSEIESSLGTANARISELEKFVNDLDQLVE